MCENEAVGGAAIPDDDAASLTTLKGEPPMKHRVQALWNNFRNHVMHPASPPDQVREMRRAFYAGVECALNRIGSEMSAGDSLDDPSDEQVIREVNQELQQFAKDVKEGRA